MAKRPAIPNDDATSRTGTIDRLADPAGNDLEARWEQDWEQTLIEAAMQRVKEQANLKDCQMFDLYVLRQWPVREVAKTLGVNVGRVYLAKHRIGKLMKVELRKLEGLEL